jgi:hypothetical protein
VACRPNVLEVPLDLFLNIRGTLFDQCEHLSPSPVIAAVGTSPIAPSESAEILCDRFDFTSNIKALLMSLTGPSTLGKWLILQKTTADEKLMVRTFYIAVESGIWTVEDPSHLPWRTDSNGESTPT